jgi:hypothetical protein
MDDKTIFVIDPPKRKSTKKYKKQPTIVSRVSVKPIPPPAPVYIAPPIYSRSPFTVSPMNNIFYVPKNRSGNFI